MLAELSNVTKSYRSDAGAVPVLNGISLTIAEGETVVLRPGSAAISYPGFFNTVSSVSVMVKASS